MVRASAEAAYTAACTGHPAWNWGSSRTHWKGMVTSSGWGAASPSGM